MPNPLAAMRINADRLWSRLMEMATIGATPSGGCNRQALSDADMAGRRLLKAWAEAAGCEVRVDAIGNLFVRRAGSDESLAVVMTGSHLDTQPTGGKFDGVYGVLAGLEVIESLHDQRSAPAHPIELCVWCNEEGCRFSMAMMGSAVWAGRLALRSAYAQGSRAGSACGGRWRRRECHARRSRAPAVKAAFEAHIEQGPIFEQQRKTIGIVTGVQHMCRHEVMVDGRKRTPDHAHGQRPRSDSRAGGRAAGALRAAERAGPDARMTVGIIETHPGSPNTVPGRLRFTVDMRHPEQQQYRALRDGLQRSGAQALAAP